MPPQVEVIRGEISGIPVTFIDTPGLEPSAAAIGANLAKLHAAKRAWNRHKPQAVLYVDRLDMGGRDQADLQVGGREQGASGACVRAWDCVWSGWVCVGIRQLGGDLGRGGGVASGKSPQTLLARSISAMLCSAHDLVGPR